MTHAAPRRQSNFHKVWLLPAVAFVLIVLATSVGSLSRSVLIDFVAWWPVWAMVALVGWLARGRRIGAIRISGIVSLGALGLIVVFLVAHLQGWPLMPSSVPGLRGTGDSDVETAALSARIAGELVVVTEDSGILYTVVPIREGGAVGVPTATESAQDGNVSVSLDEPADPGLYQFAGWHLGLSPNATWSLSFAGLVDAALEGLAIESLQIDGSGRVRLGEATSSTPLSVAGTFTIDIPRDTAVRVVGPAEVPGSWTIGDGGSTSPTEGQGWVIAVADGATVRISER